MSAWSRYSPRFSAASRGSDTADKRTLAESLAMATVRLAQTIDPSVAQNVKAAETMLKSLLALLRAPTAEGDPPPPATPQVAEDNGSLEASLESLTLQLKASKPAR